LIFAIFGCSAHSKNELRRNGWRWTDSLRTGTAIYAFGRLVSIRSNFLLEKVMFTLVSTSLQKFMLVERGCCRAWLEASTTSLDWSK